MRFTRLLVENFRGIERISLEDLQDLVLIAGPNGCGKSCVLDAMRLLKSLYGGYQANEYQMWFGEFNLNPNRPGEFSRLLRNSDRAMVLEASVQLSQREIDYLRQNAELVVEPVAWRQVTGHDVRGIGYGFPALADLQSHVPQVQATINQLAPELRSELQGTSQTHNLRITISPNGQPMIDRCLPLQMVFENYEPAHLGVLEFHSASRIYEREAIGGVNLNLDSVTEQRRTQAIYNWREKYKNVKSELATHYVREAISARSSTPERFDDLNATLSSLFDDFIPDKSYDGPRANPMGTVEFPVWVDGGGSHDIDELSSGEKELIYGYLRLRNSAPHSSTILLDEPELHLNPRLLQGLPDFYHENLGHALGNQLWLVTHSDALLRQAVGKDQYSVYHMVSATSALSEDPVNQAVPITVDDGLERAVVDIVGDIAAYRPRGKVVILEGDPGAGIDVEIVTRLFPDFAKRVNLVSGGNKDRVRDLYEILAEAASSAGMVERFYAVTDRDHNRDEIPDVAQVMRWDRYHIENFLVEPEYVRQATIAVGGSSANVAVAEVEHRLRLCAEFLINKVVLEFLQEEVNNTLVRSIRIGASPDTTSPAVDLTPSIEGSRERFVAAADEVLSPSWLREKEQSLRDRFTVSLQSAEWKREIPGRSILNLYVERHLDKIGYDSFRHVIVDKMVAAEFQPDGIATVVNAILID